MNLFMRTVFGVLIGIMVGYGGEKLIEPRLLKQPIVALPKFDVDDAYITESMTNKTLQGYHLLLPLAKDKFKVDLVETYVEDQRHATAYINLDATYGGYKFTGLAAARYEYIAGGWHPRFVEDIDLVQTTKLEKEKK